MKNSKRRTIPIHVSIEAHKELCKLKNHKKEPHDSVVVRLIEFYKKYKEVKKSE